MDSFGGGEERGSWGSEASWQSGAGGVSDDWALGAMALGVQDRVGMGAGVSGMTGDDDMYELRASPKWPRRRGISSWAETKFDQLLVQGPAVVGQDATPQGRLRGRDEAKRDEKKAKRRAEAEEGRMAGVCEERERCEWEGARPEFDRMGELGWSLGRPGWYDVEVELSTSPASPFFFLAATHTLPLEMGEWAKVTVPGTAFARATRGPNKVLCTQVRRRRDVGGKASKTERHKKKQAIKREMRRRRTPAQHRNSGRGRWMAKEGGHGDAGQTAQLRGRTTGWTGGLNSWWLVAVEEAEVAWSPRSTMTSTMGIEERVAHDGSGGSTGTGFPVRFRNYRTLVEWIQMISWMRD
ncbi:hypothetical protein B0J13DRAFT_606595 [Dactylonectria estremocensis]|uniref:Uncharacterized protein n=1 Tax=Dactylonectria estremocensis TaxID=1079267 RepID=A0A9P9J9P5_9HYPO|nr:hypothetical protein B0J13DRAFT_606595 [Dactylonectria estremocensis]